ncbi:HD-GYP domain-containing protein [Fundidesulfovibrio agrisoli]|uniref:HD-GYP domain-containing protein n=1 Tax=Fundidesulfovibrio agrisoli TaxID=2922717 RepID=UPI001FAD7446|nr:HD-GYP domain-containing protein [Fundidesulfovibrio agrisoli]
MLKKVRIFDLQVGMYIVDTGLSWLDHPYLYAEEGPIRSEEHIREVRAGGFAEAFIETDRNLHNEASARIYDRAAIEKAVNEALRDGAGTFRSNKSSALADELPVALAVQGKALAALGRAMEAVASGGTIDPGPCLESARDIAASVTRNRDALICLTKHHDAGSYSVRHGVGVAVAAAAFGDSLGLSRNQVTDLTVAGLLHDVGKALSPGDLLDKPGRLTDEEYARLKRHPVESCSVISGCMTLPEHVLRGIAEHHERHDGSGYPQGLKGAEQCFHGRLLAVADVFDALTQVRPYKERLLPDKALSVMYSMREKDFGQALLDRFIKCLGIYPAGSLVRLSTGEHAVVCQSNPDTPLRPKITIVFDQDMSPVHPVSMDLSGKDGPAPATPVNIVGIVDPRPHGISARHLL